MMGRFPEVEAAAPEEPPALPEEAEEEPLLPQAVRDRAMVKAMAAVRIR